MFGFFTAAAAERANAADIVKLDRRECFAFIIFQFIHWIKRDRGGALEGGKKHILLRGNIRNKQCLRLKVPAIF